MGWLQAKPWHILVISQRWEHKLHAPDAPVAEDHYGGFLIAPFIKCRSGWKNGHNKKLKKKKSQYHLPSQDWGGLQTWIEVSNQSFLEEVTPVLLKILNNLIELWSQILHLSRVRSSNLQRHSKSKLLDNSMKPWKKLFANSFLYFLVFLYHLHSLYRNANCH